MRRESLLAEVGGSRADMRLQALKDLVAAERKHGDVPTVNPQDANNHIHTVYSFSPYTPAMAAYRAYWSGLQTMGIMDHDSLSGAWEFIEACGILGTGCTVGFETRVHFKQGNFGRINNPDQPNHAYVAAHGIPHQNIDAFNGYLSELREKRNRRNRAMTQKIDDRFKEYGIRLDFEGDVMPLSQAESGGTVTERHLMYALAHKIFAHCKTGNAVCDFVSQKLDIPVSDKLRGYLCDAQNDFKLYDLLGLLKSDTGFFYIPATDESPDVGAFSETVHRMGAILAYPYLGDVGSSVTGDKRAQKFEDDYLDALFPLLKDLAFDAVAYMPTRNTEAQLMRVRALCKQYAFFEISGEDINSPRQKFECPMLASPMYASLIESTWALIGHEKSATRDLGEGMFTEAAKRRFPDLDERVKHYAGIGRK